MSDFYWRNKVFKSELGKSAWVYKIIPKELTVRKTIEPGLIEPLTEHYLKTPFYEVNIVPYHEAQTQEVADFVAKGCKSKNISKQKFSKLYYETLKRVIKENWESDKFHVLLQSSGYDSRLISMAIKDNHKELGDRWLGDIIIVESGSEFKLFKKIMKHMDWKPYQYTVYNNGDNPDLNINEYYSDNFDFKKAWKRLNGYSSYPMNQYDLIVDWLYDTNIIPENREYQGWSGYGSNETTLAIAWNMGIPWYFRHYYYHGLSHFPRENWVFPYLHFDMLDLLQTYGQNYAKETFSKRAGIPELVLNELFPELQKIPKMYLEDLVNAGYRTISDSLLEQVSKDYFASWYGKNVNPNVKPQKQIDYLSWWVCWSMASFCEYLLENNYNILIGQ